MKTYIVAPSRSSFDAVVRSKGLDRREVVYISHGHQVRGLTLQSQQVIYADGCGSLPDFPFIQKYLERAVAIGESRARDDQRTRRLTITDLDGEFIGSRLVTERQAKDALG